MKKSRDDYYILKRYDVLTLGEVSKLIVKQESPNDAIHYFVTIEETYDIIKKSHIALNHAGRDKMVKELNKKYVNISANAIKVYKSLCEECQLRQWNANKGVVVKPIPKVGLSNSSLPNEVISMLSKEKDLEAHFLSTSPAQNATDVTSSPPTHVIPTPPADVITTPPNEVSSTTSTEVKPPVPICTDFSQSTAVDHTHDDIKKKLNVSVREAAREQSVKVKALLNAHAKLVVKQNSANASDPIYFAILDAIIAKHAIINNNMNKECSSCPYAVKPKLVSKFLR